MDKVIKNWHRYCNKHWAGNRNFKILLEIDKDFGEKFILKALKDQKEKSCIETYEALKKQRTEIENEWEIRVKEQKADILKKIEGMKKKLLSRDEIAREWKLDREINSIDITIYQAEVDSYNQALKDIKLL